MRVDKADRLRLSRERADLRDDLSLEPVERVPDPVVAVDQLAVLVFAFDGIATCAGWLFGAVLAALVGLIGAVLGFFSIGRVGKQPEVYKGTELAIAGVVVNILAFLMGVGVILFVVIAGAAYFATMTGGSTYGY